MCLKKFSGSKENLGSMSKDVVIAEQDPGLDKPGPVQAILGPKVTSNAPEVATKPVRNTPERKTNAPMVILKLHKI